MVPINGSGLRELIIDDADVLHQLILTDQVVLVIGGKAGSGSSAYQSVDDIDAFLGTSNGSSPDDYNAHIDMRHITDYFLMASSEYAGPQVYHVPAIDGRESAVEAKSAANRTGLLQRVSEAELCERAAEIFKEPTYKDADTIILNYDIVVPFPDDVSLETYIEYLSGRIQRAFSAVSAVGQSWSQSMSGTDPKPRQVIVLINNLLSWLRATRGEISMNEQAMKLQSHKFKTAYAVDLFFIEIEMTQQDHDEVGTDERKWRSAVKTLVQYGHKQSITRDIGLRIVSRVAGQPRECVSLLRVVKDYKAELRDRIFRETSPSTRLPEETQRIDVFGRSNFFSYVNSLEQWRGQDSRHEDSENPVPFAGYHILIVDSGRGDGITAALCKLFYNLGARVAFTYDSNRSNGDENADLILSGCQDGPGFVVKVKGIPYRSSQFEESSGAPFVEEMIMATLKALDTKTIDCMVNNAGWSYSLKPLQSDRERMRLIKRDSRRNLLALDYVMFCMSRFMAWGERPHLVNIAGLACNPAMGLCAFDDWTFMNKSMRGWFALFREPNLQSILKDNVNLAISTVVPGSIMDNAIRPSSQAKSLAWQAKLVKMYNRWNDQTYVEETARIVRLLIDPCNADQPGEFIAPDDGPLSTQHYPELVACAATTATATDGNEAIMNTITRSNSTLKQRMELNRLATELAKKQMDEMRDQIEYTKQEQQQEYLDVELSEREDYSLDGF